MANSNFLLDPEIRLWVFLPIVVITFLVEILRHYLLVLCNSQKDWDLDKIQDMEMKKRVTMLQKNYMFITRQAFEVRKNSFNPDHGFLPKKRKPLPPKRLHPFMLNHQVKMLNFFKSHSGNVLPMLITGAWVSYTFSGFITTRVPFPLTFSFRPMLQRDIDLTYLDPSWVSSISWYFLNIFGIRNLCGTIFDENLDFDMSEMDLFGKEEKMSFKGDFEGLEMVVYRWELEGSEKELLEKGGDC